MSTPKMLSSRMRLRWAMVSFQLPPAACTSAGLLPLAHLAGSFFVESAHGLPDDVVHDVGGRVIDATGFLDFRLFPNNGAMAFGQPDDFAKKLFIDLAENLCRQRREYVRRFGIVKALQNVAEEL